MDLRFNQHHYIKAFFLFLVLCFAPFLESEQVALQIRYPLKYEALIKEKALKYGFDPLFIQAVVLTESSFNPLKTSPAKAKGLMQVTNDTAYMAARHLGWKNFKPDDLFDPAINLEIGCWFLAHIRSLYPNNYPVMLSSYNAGLGNVRVWLKNKRYSDDGIHLKAIPIPETKNYVQNVLFSYGVYQQLYPF